VDKRIACFSAPLKVSNYSIHARDNFLIALIRCKDLFDLVQAAALTDRIVKEVNDCARDFVCL